MMKNENLKFALVTAIIFALGGILIYYVLENPTDTMVERMLSTENIFRALRQHIVIVGVSMGGALLVGIPGGILLSRPRFYYIGKVFENVVNVGQTVPSLAILALFYTILGLGFNTAVFAIWLYSILPILRNTFAGITSISDNVIESARGMGMTNWRILKRIELPLAAPIIVTGIRTAIVINVGTAALATFIGAGGLGDLIVTGLSIRRNMIIVTGAGLSALLAILLDFWIGQLKIRLINW
ncbi:MAG: ABC transporter permease [Bacillota bacterium]